MTGKIQIEEEQKIVTRNSLNSEKLDKQTRLTQSERNYFDRNMILNLKQFEAVFCSALSYRSTIASLCKTSPVKAPDTNQINGKQLIEVHDNANQDHSFIEQWQQEMNKHKALINELKQSEQNQQTSATNANHHLNGEYHARNNQSTTGGTSTTSGNHQTQKTSASKSDYLF